MRLQTLIRIGSKWSGSEVCKFRSLEAAWVLAAAVFIVVAASVWTMTGRNAVQSLPDKPSIAVLPFDNIGNDPKWDRLADAITEDIISDLSRYDKLRTMPNLIRVKSCNLQRPKASG